MSKSELSASQPNQTASQWDRGDQAGLSDQAGVVVSLLCLIHCVAPAICASLFPVVMELSGSLARDSAEVLVHFLLAPLVIFTAIASARSIHRKCAGHCICKLAFLTGAALIFFGTLSECFGIAKNIKITFGNTVIGTTTLESLLTVSAGLVLACAHLHRIIYPLSVTTPASKQAQKIN